MKTTDGGDWIFDFGGVRAMNSNPVSMQREGTHIVLLNVICIHLGWQLFLSITVGRGNSEKECWLDAVPG